MSWFVRGLRAGIRTEDVPDSSELRFSVSPGLPRATTFSTVEEAADNSSLCPTGALNSEGRVVNVDGDRCVECMRCKTVQEWRRDASWAYRVGSAPLDGAFKRSIHVRIVDAGDCGSCLNELAQLNGPSYNLHRFGVFITPTPRQADVLLVVGPVTRQMLDPLKFAYEAMPAPKRVVAVGACAASGGVFGPSVMCGAGAADAVPVDLVVPGCPPPPLAIVHALRAVCGQEKLT
jgi:Ni,Fe-hydrogenase III small subunit/ferredoxin-like protein FixX